MPHDNYFEHPSSSSGTHVSYTTVRLAMEKELGKKPYHMSLTSQDEIRAVIDCVNAGIDSHLEACFCPDRGDKYETGNRKVGNRIVLQTLECEISAESLPTLLRRLSEIDFEDSNEAQSLVSDILTTLGVDEYGKYVGSKALGV
jgi:hypothetical protein